MPKDTHWRGSSPEAVAYQTDLNAFEDADGKKRYEIEQLFSTAETHIGPILKGLAPEKPITPGERRWIAVLAGLTKTCVPVARGFVQTELDKRAAAFAHEALAAYKKNPAAFPGVTSERAEHLRAAKAGDFEYSVGKHGQARASTGKHGVVGATLAGIEPIARYVFSAGWTLWYARPPLFFWASDNPVCLYDRFYGRVDSGFGPALISPATEVTLPVTRSIALLARRGVPDQGWREANEEIVRSINLRSAALSKLSILSPKRTVAGVNEVQAVAESAGRSPMASGSVESGSVAGER